jgi:hypothetical protein
LGNHPFSALPHSIRRRDLACAHAAGAVSNHVITRNVDGCLLRWRTRKNVGDRDKVHQVGLRFEKHVCRGAKAFHPRQWFKHTGFLGKKKFLVLYSAGAKKLKCKSRFLIAPFFESIKYVLKRRRPEADCLVHYWYRSCCPVRLLFHERRTDGFVEI